MGGTRGIVPAISIVHSRPEEFHALELRHRAIQSAVEALWARWSHFGNG